MGFELISVVVSIAISVLAFIVSIISLWKSSLARFKLKLSYGSPTLVLYKIVPEISGRKTTWWIPSIGMGFTFHNLGKCSGEVVDIRLVGCLESEKCKRKFVFYAKWIVDYPKFEPIHTERFEWIDKSIEREWYPLILAGGEEKSLHVIFEGRLVRWDEKYLGNMCFSLEVFSSEKEKWTELSTYNIKISADMYESKSMHQLENPKLEKVRGDAFKDWEIIPSEIESNEGEGKKNEKHQI